MTPLDPRVSVFESAEDEAAYAAWLSSELDERAADGREPIPHDQVGANLAARLKQLERSEKAA
ncbi:MAG: stability determinant [Candidatus Accumulibacter sp.]|jgi:hypothetical protein|nr:stability determinant [Accumulibacter sp.]